MNSYLATKAKTIKPSYMRENYPTVLGLTTLREGNYVHYILVELRMKMRIIIFTGASAKFIIILFALQEHSV